MKQETKGLVAFGREVNEDVEKPRYSCDAGCSHVNIRMSLWKESQQ